MASRGTGFTLIELLVAITILAIVAVLGWRGLDGIVRARVALTEEMEQTRGLQLAFAQLDSDCAQLALSTAIGGRSVLVAEDGKITLVRNVYADDQAPQIQVIAYRLVDGVLTRQETAATRDLADLDTYWKAALGDSGLSAPIALHGGIAAMSVLAWSNAVGSWSAAASVTAQNSNGQTGSSFAFGPGSGPGTPYRGSRGRGPAARSLQPIGGLQVALQLRNREATVTKTFLLGAT